MVKVFATRLIKIFETVLIPFVKQVYPHKHRLMQDNNPKHSSQLACNFLESNDIFCWKMPLDNPDLNPIENVWGLRKELFFMIDTSLMTLPLWSVE